jgi:sugar phosphate permease
MIVMRTLLAKPSFWLLSLGAGAGSILGYGLAFWLPAFLTRSRGLELMDISWFYGSIALIGGSVGIWLGGWFGDRLGRIRPSGYPLIPAVCFLFAAPLYAVGIYTTSLTLAWFAIMVATALSLAWLGPVIAAVQHIVPPNMRATSSAAFLLVNNLLGIGFGIWFIGKLSDLLTPSFGDAALQHAMLYGLGFYLLSSALYFLASSRLSRDWYRG